MQKIFPCLDIKKIFSPFLNVQQETIFSDGKSFAIINPWDCLEVGVKNLFDKLNLKILPIEVNIIKSSLSLEIKEYSFISNESEDLIILTSIGRIFKFNLSNKFLTPTSKQSQGLIIAKLLPSEKIVSCCTFKNGENIFLISKQGKIFCINSNEIYCSNEYSLGYLNEKTQLKNDYFLKIMASNHYLDIETNKNKSARLDLNKLNFKSNKSNFLIDFLKLDNDEYLENCFRLENFLD